MQTSEYEPIYEKALAFTYKQKQLWSLRLAWSHLPEEQQPSEIRQQLEFLQFGNSPVVFFGTEYDSLLFKQIAYKLGGTYTNIEVLHALLHLLDPQNELYTDYKYEVPPVYLTKLSTLSPQLCILSQSDGYGGHFYYPRLMLYASEIDAILTDFAGGCHKFLMILDRQPIHKDINTVWDVVRHNTHTLWDLFHLPCIALDVYDTIAGRDHIIGEEEYIAYFEAMYSSINSVLSLLLSKHIFALPLALPLNIPSLPPASPSPALARVRSDPHSVSGSDFSSLLEEALGDSFNGTK